MFRHGNSVQSEDCLCGAGDDVHRTNMNIVGRHLCGRFDVGIDFVDQVFRYGLVAFNQRCRNFS